MSVLRAERTIFALVLALGVMGTRPAGAEGVDETGETPRVRVTTAHGQFAGRLVAVGDLTIDLEQAQKGKLQTVQVSRPEILGVEVSQRPNQKGLGLALGVAAGFGAALAIGAWSCGGSSAASCVPGASECNDTHRSCSSVELTALSCILTLPLGAWLGHAIAPGEKWRPGDLKDLSLQPAVTRGGGVGIRLVVGF